MPVIDGINARCVCESVSMVTAEMELQQQLDATIEEGVVLIDFNAPWCAPCRALDPIISELKESFLGRARITKVNIDEFHAVAMRLGIQSIPTMILFKKGREIRRFVGLQSADTLARAIDNALRK
jgi:thioredoxin 1